MIGADDRIPGWSPEPLITARLAMEPFSPADSDGLFRMWSRPEVCRYSGPAEDERGRPVHLPARTAADSDGILRFFIAKAQRRDGLRWAVRTRVDGTFVGAVGFNRVARRAEIAWHLHPDAWGHGFATEAARAAMDWFARLPGAGGIEAFVEPGNANSIRLLQRLGFTNAHDRSGAAAREADDGTIRYERSVGVTG